MSKTAYDTIGKDYNQNRRADGRLVDRIAGLLDLPAGAVIADIGAGTGNYAAALADRGLPGHGGGAVGGNAGPGGAP